MVVSSWSRRGRLERRLPVASGRRSIRQGSGERYAALGLVLRTSGLEGKYRVAGEKAGEAATPAPLAASPQLARLAARFAAASPAFSAFATQDTERKS
jgi:hypothetical protein